jgi:hypothetical protein
VISHDNHYGFGKEYLDWLIDYQLLNNSAAWKGDYHTVTLGCAARAEVREEKQGK